MLTVKLDPRHATVDDAGRRLEIDPSQIDRDFGVVSIDPDESLFAVLVDEDVAEGARGKAGVSGPFSNPRIEPFGPPTAS